MRKLLVTIALSVAALLALALPALASTTPCHHKPPVVTVTAPHHVRTSIYVLYDRGVLTTPCVVYPGEVLEGIGYVTGTFVITSVTPDGNMSLITLSSPPVQPQTTQVLDFLVKGHPPTTP